MLRVMALDILRQSMNDEGQLGGQSDVVSIFKRFVRGITGTISIPPHTNKMNDNIQRQTSSTVVVLQFYNRSSTSNTFPYITSMRIKSQGDHIT